MTLLEAKTPFNLMEKIFKTKAYSLELHGITHWNRVYENCVTLANMRDIHNEINDRFFVLFALLHDHMRNGDGPCKYHATNGSNKIKSILTDINLSFMNERDVNLLKAAISMHTSAMPDKPDLFMSQLSFYEQILVEICWDADRLDIDRVYPTIDEKFLFTKEAKKLASYKNRKRHGEHITDR